MCIRDSYTVVRVAKKQMGVGGDDSWGSHTHPEYLLDVSENCLLYTFHNLLTFRISALKGW